MDISLKEMMAIDGAIGAVVVDYNSGMALGALGGSKDLDLQVAAAGNTEVVKAKMRTMESLGLKDGIEDILITLGTQYHVIRPISGRGGKGCSSTWRSRPQPGQPRARAAPPARHRGEARGLILRYGLRPGRRGPYRSSRPTPEASPGVF